MNIPTFAHQNFSRYTLLLLCFGFTYTLDASAAKELVSIKDAWVRPTSPGQEVGAAYMTLTSIKDMNLVSVESDVADSVEIHNMTMENGVMKMRMLETLPLKAGVPYRLAPGGFHLMLFDLKKPLLAGEEISFVMAFKNKNKTLSTQKVKAKVQAPPESGTSKNSH
ncbi:copper chaperone PCu(A)C [Methylotenera sp.]|uniref:copper chaperone PCu(A)C n=1 Tax=Methylotenera sp. TaxID=2051956 RepID=UPI0027282BBF|nr:copper chaperone PCu(A)C [Methylotenera sp.]MDO9394279.1 copper chaperone PCu(A)C [Methylotenera sp.]MDP1523478.1 copper chaperone PCu(A)C [Methylotenera sp.]MDP2070034.1 copper chaperone PCu(A)C [Methylotenera sp.]MDP3006513.1 copper chaperone PCu(A)C [Methylotenera sp.]MDZ4210330.1 copper chaperone PCu(A)C [Methylotenera sp.]